MRRTIEWWLAFIAGLDAVLVPVLFAQGQQPLFPLPGLYFIEIACLGLVGFASVVMEPVSDSRWKWVPWGVAGILLAFNVLGAWTIGYYLLPATLGFLVAGFSRDRRLGRGIRPQVGLFLIAALAQGALILGLVSLGGA